jgi:ABC-type nickel/cobalt efflux system permease component RcnA
MTTPHLRRAGRALLLALAVLAVGPAAALAHPLGNFTINHFAAIRVGSDRISLDVVLDEAEIPTFQERQRLDTNGDGTVSPDEVEAARQVACQTLASSLALTVSGQRLSLAVDEAGISFPPGAGGLVTMRTVCEYSAVPASPISSGTAIGYQDQSFAERIGWREIVLLGDGITLAAGSTGADPAGTDPAGVSRRLTLYPTNLLTQPLNQTSASTTASPGGPSLPAWSAPDAAPLTASGTSAAAAGSSLLQAVPGGVAPELGQIIDAGGLEPGVLLLSLLLAAGLGAAHAISPGHGKTIMAAYLVGTRGSARHAIGLGLTVTISHTLGVLALAGVTLLAANLLPPDRLYPVLGVASGALVIVIGGSLLWSRGRVLFADRAHARAHANAHEHGHDHEHAREHDHEHDHGHSHSHEPAPGTALSWKSLFALGLSGGLVPSASALILLLGSISAGRIGYGIVLVVAFGAGMAIVLAGIGLALVRASTLVSRLPSRWRQRGAGRMATYVQMGTAGLVIALGLVLTSQALTTVL